LFCKRCLLAATAVLFTLTGCGGGGGGSSSVAPAVSPPPAAPAEFVPGEFLPSPDFWGFCAVPRTGIDPGTGTSFPDTQGTITDEKNWLRSWSNELYLWFDEIADVNPATHVGTTADYFDLMKTFLVTASDAPKDQFHFSIPTEEFQSFTQSGVLAGYGATFAFLQSTSPSGVVVAYTEPNTPATSALLVRGTTILTVDDVDLVDATSPADFDTINAGLFPSNIDESHQFSILDPGETVARTVTMVSASITSDPVQNVGTIVTPTGNVGYMLFNDHIATAELDLINAVEQLSSAGITDLVLDVRYNGGGFLDIANELGFMIAGDATATGRVFDQIFFSSKHPTFNPVTGQLLVPDLFHSTAVGFSAQPGLPLPSLNLSRVFVLTGPGTCSASEAIINGLRGIDIEVIQIGSTTCGKPYGFYPFDNCGTTWFSVQFKGANAEGFGDYTDGFTPQNTVQTQGTVIPGCSVADDFTHQLGDQEEARFAAALVYRESGDCPLFPSGLGSSRASVAGSQPDLSAVDGHVPKPFWLQNRIMSQQHDR
jgi:carboxyl-terminal processing protease